VRLATKVVLGVVRLALGRRGPSELAARQRLRRLGLEEVEASGQVH
jgi:hypothetical protein